MNNVEKTFRAFQDIACEQERARIEKQRRERFGIPETPVYEIRKLPDFPPILRDRELHINVSPYAKFDKYHKKNRKRK